MRRTQWRHRDSDPVRRLPGKLANTPAAPTTWLLVESWLLFSVLPVSRSRGPRRLPGDGLASKQGPLPARGRSRGAGLRWLPVGPWCPLLAARGTAGCPPCTALGRPELKSSCPLPALAPRPPQPTPRIACPPAHAPTRSGPGAGPLLRLHEAVREKTPKSESSVLLCRDSTIDDDDERARNGDKSTAETHVFTKGHAPMAGNPTVIVKCDLKVCWADTSEPAQGREAIAVAGTATTQASGRCSDRSGTWDNVLAESSRAEGAQPVSQTLPKPGP